MLKSVGMEAGSRVKNWGQDQILTLPKGKSEKLKAGTLSNPKVFARHGG
jgi:hypothetical protein